MAGRPAGKSPAGRVLVERRYSRLRPPQRKSLIPGFEAVQAAAKAAGALGCSISGAGPAMFAWAEEGKAEEVRAAMVEAFRALGITSDGWISRIEPVGARIEENR